MISRVEYEEFRRQNEAVITMYGRKYKSGSTQNQTLFTVRKTVVSGKDSYFCKVIIKKILNPGD